MEHIPEFHWHPVVKNFERFSRFINDLKKFRTELSKRSDQFHISGNIYEITLYHPDIPDKHVISWNYVVVDKNEEWFKKIIDAEEKFGFEIKIRCK